MGDSKQIISTALEAEAKKNSARKAKRKNGNNSNDQLMDEVNKLDKIREMLFGEHVATLQSKYQTLDKNLDKTVTVLRKELNTSVEELKQQINKKFDLLQKNLQSEQSDRVSQNEELNTNLANTHSDILTKIDLEGKRIDAALNEQYEESMRQLNSMVESLQDAKVDRKSLAALFSQFAKELEGK